MSDFTCPYAEPGKSRCPAWRCDCFIETHPEDPFGLHPEDFTVVGLVAAPTEDDSEAVPTLEELDIEAVHVRWADGKCRVSLNGQGHFPCEEHPAE